MSGTFARFAPRSYATVHEGLARAMVRSRVGRNGWPVMMALCHRIYADGRLGRASAEEISRRTGLTRAQVARGMTELRGKGIIEPVTRKAGGGPRRPDRSAYGHVAQYRIVADVWSSMEPAPTGPLADDSQGAVMSSAVMGPISAITKSD